MIEDVIGEGGMGVVYRCHHNILDTRYALKVLNANLARVELLRQRFLAEAKIQAMLRHPHIVHVLDVIDGQKDGGIPGVLAIVMEYVEGESLDQMLESGPLSEYDAVSCALVILDAIGFAHHEGIVHRDLKPQNIMISRQGAAEALYGGVKVMDFGIAKSLQQGDQRTATGQQMGTPRYMAPEQIENARNVDERTDLYAIGLTLYELLCGRTPFEEFKEFELLKAQLSMRPPSLRKFRPGISERLEAIVMKSLEKDRANRYPNAETFQRALLSLGGYDDIPLRLNPYEGTSHVATNQKLQDKIERTIARSGRSTDKLKKVPSRLDNEKISRMQPVALQDGEPAVSDREDRDAAISDREDYLEKEIAKQRAIEYRKAGKVSAELPSLVKAVGKASEPPSQDKAVGKVSSKKPDQGKAVSKASEHPSQVKKEKNISAARGVGRPDAKMNAGSRSGTHRRSFLNIMKGKQSQPGATGSRMVKLVHSIEHMARSGTKGGETARERQKKDAQMLENQSSVQASAKRDGRLSENVSVAGKSETVQANASSGRVGAVRRDARKADADVQGGASRGGDAARRDARKTDADGQGCASRAGDALRRDDRKADAAKTDENKPALRGSGAMKHRSNKALMLFMVAVFVLLAGGLYYRYTHQMPVQTLPEETAVVEPETADFSLKEMDTDTGRMTVVPAGLHWVSTAKKDELHQVKLGAFAIDQVEVSYYEYGKCIEAGKCAPLKRAVEDLNLPVTGIGYGSAEAFCAYAGKALPSADQWEAAARYGGETNGITHVNVACDTVNFGSGARGECKNNTGAESVFYRVQGGNPGHILNMLGNVREWTTTADRKDPQKHLTKGGSYKSPRSEISIGEAHAVGINSGAEDVGFRCVREM